MLVKQLAAVLRDRNQTVATIESCTGGGIAKALTDLQGSSSWFETGFVTYSNESKHRLVNVPTELLDLYGAVSPQVAEAMALGGQCQAKSDFAMAVTGIAGPGGGSKEKPVGLVYFGWALPEGSVTSDFQIFAGDRIAVREQTIQFALEGLVKCL